MKFLKNLLGSADKETGATAPEDRAAVTLEAAISDRLAAAMGVKPTLFKELVPDTVSIDILCFEPTATRSFWVFSTLGMGSQRMTVPEGADPAIWGRVELMVGLHAEWGAQVAAMMQDPKSGSDAVWWPIRHLKAFGRYPHTSGAFLADGHTLSAPGGAPFDSSTQMNAAMISYPTILPEADVRFEVPGGDMVTLLGLVFLYGPELGHKDNVGLDAFCLDLEEQGVSEVIHPDRRPMVG